MRLGVTLKESLADGEHARLAGLVAFMLPHLQWRHNGLGLLQAYVHEGKESELRVHIWHNSLKRPGIEESGLLHDHRFDLRSTALVGSLHHIEYEVRPEVLGNREGGPQVWQLHSVVPARKALAKSGTNDGLVEALPEKYFVQTRSVPIFEGERYFFPKFNFHGTHMLSDLVVTLAEKSAQEEAQAKILAPYGKPVVHAFADPFPERMWLPVINAARQRLIETWKKLS